MAGASRRPERIAGVDPDALPIGPNEQAVFALVDGRRSVAEIARDSGLSMEAVDEALELLVFGGAVAAASDEGAVPAAETAAARPALEAEVVEIDEARRATIDEVHASLEGKTHYELLGVPMDAEKAAIKAAYFELIPVFHPDKYFGKKLGPYKQKLEKIFEKLTRAHDVLARKQTRAEYDEYLGLAPETDERPPAAADSLLQKYLAEVEDEERRRVEAPPAARPSPPPPPRTLLSADARRRALARKLAGKRPAVVPSVPAEPTPEELAQRAAARDRAAEDLKRLHRFRAGGGFQQAQRVAAYVRRAEEIVESDPVAAKEMLQKAHQLAPDDDGVKRSFEVAERRAAEAQADVFQRRARYEEQQGEWSRAAESYGRVVAGRPDDAEALERAAFCQLKAGSDLRRAVELAKRAVLADPTLPAARATAARAYQAAGMRKSAVGEARRATELDPSDRSLAALLESLERG